MDKPFPAYQGDEPYVFVCYAHGDEDEVYPEIGWLHEQGINLWYDEGISAGRIWREEIGDAIKGASNVLYYISESSLASDHCDREINFALDQHKNVLPVYLEDVALTTDLEVGLSRVQALHRDQDTSYHQHLLNTLGGRSSTAAVQPSVTAGKKPTWQRYAGLGLTVAILVGLALAWVLSERTVSPAADVAPADALPNRVAILPFENMSPDPDDAYFAAGIHEEILTQLAKIKALTIIARTSVLPYANTDKTIPTIARELNVETVMEGSVRYADDRVRVTAQLIDARTNAHIWTETYDGNREDIFAIQTSIAKQVAGAVHAQLTDAEVDRLEKTRTTNIDAYNHYLLALHHLSRGEIDAAEDYLQMAIELDPQFAAAYGGLSSISFFRGRSVMPMKDAFRDYKRFAERAYEIDSDEPIALGLMSYVRLWEGDYVGGEAFRRKLLQVAPNDPNSYGLLANWSLPIGEKITYQERAVKLDPVNVARRITLTNLLILARRYEEALAAIEEALKLEPENAPALVYAGGVHWYLQNYEEANGLFDQALAVFSKMPSSVGILSTLALLEGRMGNEEAARVHIEDLHKVSNERYVAPIQFLNAYAGVQDAENALHWMNRWFEEDGFWLPEANVLCNPLYLFVRAEDGYRDLVQRIRSHLPPDKAELLDCAI